MFAINFSKSSSHSVGYTTTNPKKYRLKYDAMCEIETLWVYVKLSNYDYEQIVIMYMGNQLKNTKLNNFTINDMIFTSDIYDMDAYPGEDNKIVIRVVRKL